MPKEYVKASVIVSQINELIEKHGDLGVRIAYGNAACFYEVEAMAQHSEEYNCIYVDGTPEDYDF